MQYPANIMERRRRNARRRVWYTSVFLSLISHAVAGMWFDRLDLARPHEKVEKPDEPEVIQIALLAPGDRLTEANTAPPPPPSPPIPTPTPAPKARQAPPTAPPTSPPAPQGTLPLWSPLPFAPGPAPVEPAPPVSFAAWEQNRWSRFKPNLFEARGSPDGVAPMTRDGRKKCAPAPDRPVERVYLLFDTSGSMSDLLRAQALSCAQQYARHAIDAGASVVIGNFAGQVTLSEPTTDIMDVGFALRSGNDPTRTVLPGRELNRYFERNPGLTSDIVILSDGGSPTSAK